MKEKACVYKAKGISRYFHIFVSLKYCRFSRLLVDGSTGLVHGHGLMNTKK